MQASVRDDTRMLRWEREYPELGTGPVEPLLSEAQFELERERIFKRRWLNMGRVEELPQPGSYIVKPVSIWRTSILITRGADGVIRAFHNACIHRGNEVMSADGPAGGNCEAFTCRFHGWSYGLDGRLEAVPQERLFADFDKAGLGLKPMAADVWRGFVFVHFDAHPTETLTEQLGELAEGIKEFPFEEFPRRLRYATEIQVNWKVAMDPFQEVYHFKSLHERSFPYKQPAELQWVKLYENGNRSYSLPAFVQGVNPTPLEQAIGRFAMPGSRPVLDTRKGSTADCLNPGETDAWIADEHFIFPNFVVAMTEVDWIFLRVWPLAADRTFIEHCSYYREPKTPGELIFQERFRTQLRDVNMEDFSVLESEQRGLTSGAVPRIYLQDGEILLRHQYKTIEALTRG